MTIDKCFYPKISLYYHDFFQELLDAKVVWLSDLGKLTDSERHLCQNSIQANGIDFKMSPLEWGIAQVRNFCELCAEGHVRFDLRNQEHICLLLRMMRGMNECLGHEKGDVYEILLGLFRVILLRIRQYCVLPDKVVPFDPKTMM